MFDRGTYRGLSPEIVYFYSPEEAQLPEVKADWYIKGAKWENKSSSIDNCVIICSDRALGQFTTLATFSDPKL